MDGMRRLIEIVESCFAVPSFWINGMSERRMAHEHECKADDAQRIAHNFSDGQEIVGRHRENARRHGIAATAYEVTFDVGRQLLRKLCGHHIDKLPRPDQLDDVNVEETAGKMMTVLAELLAEQSRREVQAERENAPPTNGAQATDRPIPSKIAPKSPGERLRINSLAARMFPGGLRVKVRLPDGSLVDKEPDGPHAKALTEYLQRFTGTEHERVIWNRFRETDSHSDDQLHVLARVAAKKGLSRDEYIAREQLVLLKRYCAGQGIEYHRKLQPECSYSDDFSSIRWYGAVHDFTPNQAAVIRILWDHWARGGLAVSSQTLRDNAGVDAERLDVVFRGHAAWRTIIVPATKGSYRLVRPEVLAPPKPKSAKARPAPRKRARK